MSAVTETPLEILGDVGSTPQKISGVEETPVDVVSAEELQVKSVPDSERQTDTAETKDAGATSNTGQVSGDNDGETTVTAKTLGEPNGKDAMLDSSADSAMVEIGEGLPTSWKRVILENPPRGLKIISMERISVPWIFCFYKEICCFHGIVLAIFMLMFAISVLLQAEWQ